MGKKIRGKDHIEIKRDSKAAILIEIEQRKRIHKSPNKMTKETVVDGTPTGIVVSRTADNLKGNDSDSVFENKKILP